MLSPRSKVLRGVLRGTFSKVPLIVPLPKKKSAAVTLSLDKTHVL